MATQKETNEMQELKTAVFEQSKQIALLNQFNTKVVEPALKEMKELLKDTPTRVEFDDLKKRVEDIETNDSGDDKKYVTRREVWAIIGTIGLVGTVLGIVGSIVALTHLGA